MFHPDGWHAIRMPNLEQRTPRWGVFHASSTAPVPHTAEGAVGEGWENATRPGLNGAMFDPP